MVHLYDLLEYRVREVALLAGPPEAGEVEVVDQLAHRLDDPVGLHLRLEAVGLQQPRAGLAELRDPPLPLVVHQQEDQLVRYFTPLEKGVIS